MNAVISILRNHCKVVSGSHICSVSIVMTRGSHGYPGTGTGSGESGGSEAKKRSQVFLITNAWQWNRDPEQTSSFWARNFNVKKDPILNIARLIFLLACACFVVMICIAVSTIGKGATSDVTTTEAPIHEGAAREEQLNAKEGNYDVEDDIHISIIEPKGNQNEGRGDVGDAGDGENTEEGEPTEQSVDEATTIGEVSTTDESTNSPCETGGTSAEPEAQSSEGPASTEAATENATVAASEAASENTAGTASS